MRSTRSRVGTAVILALCLWPARALAILDGSNSSAAAIARYTGDDAGPTVTAFSDHIAVELTAMATETLTPSFGPWQGHFEYAAQVVGSGTAAHGSASGTLAVEATTTPDLLLPVNPGLPIYNTDISDVFASLQLDFREDVIVTGGVPGTPVTLTVHFLLDAEAGLAGGNPSFPRNAVARFTGRIIDESGGGSVERILGDDSLITASFDTAVGHVLDIFGHFNLFAEGVAGASGSGFFPEFTASVEASTAALWVTAPEGIELDAPSGHDYTVPEPGRALLVLASTGTLFVLRARTRRSEASIGASPA